MTPDDRSNDTAIPSDDDLGAPVTELRDLSFPLDARFSDKVRGRIERRLLARELLDLAWSGPLAVVLEFLKAPFEFLKGKRRP